MTGAEAMGRPKRSGRTIDANGMVPESGLEPGCPCETEDFESEPNKN